MMQVKIKSFTFADMENKFLVLHLDEKIIQYILGDTGDLLAIAITAISVPNIIFGLFLALPAIWNGKELVMASCVYDIEYEFLSEIEAMVF